MCVTDFRSVCLPLLQVQLTRELGAIMRNQIPAGRKSVLTAYGDILYRAWQTATGACKQEVEEFVQVRSALM